MGKVRSSGQEMWVWPSGLGAALLSWTPFNNKHRLLRCSSEASAATRAGLALAEQTQIRLEQVKLTRPLKRLEETRCSITVIVSVVDVQFSTNFPDAFAH